MTPTEKALRLRIAALRLKLRFIVQFGRFGHDNRDHARLALESDDRRARRMRERR